MPTAPASPSHSGTPVAPDSATAGAARVTSAERWLRPPAGGRRASSTGSSCRRPRSRAAGVRQTGTMPNWAAPRATKPVDATIVLPGSKSLTNRYLLLAAIADGPSRIVAPLRARDTELMAGALRALGVQIADDGTDWVVTPGALHGGTVDTGLAG